VESALAEAGYEDLRVSQSEGSSGLLIESGGRPLTAADGSGVRRTVGRAIRDNLMARTRKSPRPMMTESGQFVTGGSVDGRTLGL